jgi:hypothetical protein
MKAGSYWISEMDASSGLVFDGVRFGDAVLVEFYKHVVANLLRRSSGNLRRRNDK